MAIQAIIYDNTLKVSTNPKFEEKHENEDGLYKKKKKKKRTLQNNNNPKQAIYSPINFTYI